MNRRIVFFAMAFALALFAAPARADHHVTAHDNDDEGVKFTFDGEVRARGEWLDNLADFTDHSEGGDSDDDSYDIWPYRVRAAIHAAFSANVHAHVEVQNTGLFGNETPAKGISDPNLQGLGIDEEDTSLYQGFLELREIGGSDWALRIGRQEHTLGNEFVMGDADWYDGQSFDGVRAMLDKDKFDLNLFYYRVFESNAGCLGFCGDDNTNFMGATFNWALGDNGSAIEPYLLYLQDGSAGGPKVYSLGARWTRPRSADRAFDWNVEAALQDGEIGPNDVDIDQSAEGAEAWFGWGFGNDRKHRVHIGMYYGSGDDDGLADGENSNYVAPFQDGWAHNRLGDTEFGDFVQSTGTGVTDVNVGWSYTGEKNSFRIALHDLTLSEEFLGEDELGQELDAAWGFMYSNNLNFDVGLGWIDPGDAVGTDADEGMRLYASSRLRW